MEVTTEDVIRVITSCGAGHGNPKKRSAESVKMDIKNGFITPDRAKKIHGKA